MTYGHLRDTKIHYEMWRHIYSAHWEDYLRISVDQTPIYWLTLYTTLEQLILSKI